MFGLLKIIRVFRLSSIINNLNLREQLKMTIKIIKLCFFLILYVHVIACMWYYLVRQTQEWVPPLDFMWFTIYDQYGASSVFGSSVDLYEAPLFHKYWLSVYHSVLMLTGNEVGPRTTLETCLAALIILLGSIINANIFGHMAVLVTSLEKNSSLFQQRLDSINTSMKNMRISKKIQKKVQNYLLFTQSNQHHKEQLRSFLDNLSPTLQNEVLYFLFQDVLRKNRVLKEESDQFQNTLVKKLELNFCQPDDQLIAQGEPEKEFIYFLVKGECTVSVKEYRSGKPKFVRILQPGSMFGEVALLFNCKRTATVRSINYSIASRLSRANFDFVCSEFPQVVDKLKRQFQSYNDPWRIFLRSVLRSVAYFAPMPVSFLNDLQTMLGEEFVKNGLTVLRQHDPCQSIVFLTDGQIELCVKNTITGALEPFQTLKQGAHIGAYWVLRGQPYNFFARAKTDVTIHFLPRDVLVSLRDENIQLENAIANAENEILQCNAYGGIQCDIAHRPTKSIKSQPLMKFQRTLDRMLKFARLRRKNASTYFENVVELAKRKLSQNQEIEVLPRRATLTQASGQKTLFRQISVLPSQRFSTMNPNLGAASAQMVEIASLKKEMEEQKKSLNEIKNLLLQLVGENETQPQKFLNYKRDGAIRLSAFGRTPRQAEEEQKRKAAQLRLMQMFQNLDPQSPKTLSDRFGSPTASHNSFTNQMAAHHTLNSIARLNSRLPAAVHYSPPSKDSKVHSPPRLRLAQEQKYQEGGDVQTDNLIEELEELVAGQSPGKKQDDKQNELLCLQSPEQSPETRGQQPPVIRIEKN